METIRTGVYICHCGVNIAAAVDVKAVAEFAKGLPCVVVARDYQYMCSDPGQELIKSDIKEYGLNRVVVASCSPRMHEPTFRNACADAGLNPYCFEMANIREQCAWVHLKGATEKAKDLVASAVAKAALLEPLERKKVSVIPRALVIGGGIAGIYAALEIADKGFETYLVEKEPSIGGHMAQLDKTFPTLDCSACILSPKMVEAERHKNVQLFTYSEVKEVKGYIGNYEVKIGKKPRYVDEHKCTGCGECANACLLRGRIPNEFDAGLGKRSAIYVPFPQAVPLAYTVDAERCLYITKGKCGKYPACKEACPADAIDFEQHEEEIEIEVGTIVVATGYELLDPVERPAYGYKYDEVLTGLEFERLSVASGPTGGKIIINGKEPKEVVFISCVGSRERGGSVESGRMQDTGYRIQDAKSSNLKPQTSKRNEYCSRVCCMYIAKQAHLVRDKIPDARVRIIYNDMRAYGKGFEEFYNRVKKEGVEYIRKELEDEVEVIKRSEGDDKVIVRTVSGSERIEIEADLVVLANAIVPRRDAGELAKILKITRSGDGFFLEAHPKLRPLDTFTEGIFIAGCCQSPKDIPDSVAQAVGAAIRASIPLMRGEVEVEPLVASVNESICVGCGTCEAICPFDALSLEAGVMRVNEVVCKGCGSCGSVCPSGAISMRHFKDEQIYAQIEVMT
ncbi:MAG: CoB--CoM heterodisulfide reductase iron-sulfur subunit A family protein [Methanophagales archaeon]|nr:CoB--CoM heterodisulfide reductase iron-sulfur subunit A family protein [Methanophagales archaeon]